MILRVVLGDQLNLALSSLKDADRSADKILMCEVMQEARYVKHHKKKIALLFAAMRHFADDLRQVGFDVLYTQLDQPDNTGSFSGEVAKAVKRYKPKKVIVTMPGEYRVLQEIKSWSDRFNIEVNIRDDDRFLCDINEFADWAEDRQQLRMEYFYREMRKKYSVLIEDNRPVGGKWNYDTQNRKPITRDLFSPDTFRIKPDKITHQVLELVAERFADHFGDLQPFHFAVTRKQAVQALHQFIDQRLSLFGDYQDAMTQQDNWLYHSHLSFYLNCGLLLPLECIEAAEQAYWDKKAPLNAVEGFIRQILGWREFIRGIYWLKMPEYQQHNFFNASRNLPEFYWHADTHMNCLHHCVTTTRREAYAHHIQRLMVLGNFALLAGIDPAQVNEWYLIVYADAFEWVELPNVTGMSLFADGGVFASKPYASSGAYINKMSDYCHDCHYKVSVKHGAEACPFNYLYWDFLQRNRGKLQNNQRLGMIYQTLDKMHDNKKQTIQQDSERFLIKLEQHEKV